MLVKKKEKKDCPQSEIICESPYKPDIECVAHELLDCLFADLSDKPDSIETWATHLP